MVKRTGIYDKEDGREGGLVNKGKNAITKTLRNKQYLDEDITNFELIEQGLDDKNKQKSIKFFSFGVYRGADMILDAISDGRIKVKRDTKGVYFEYQIEKIESKRNLKVKSGEKILEVKHTAVLILDEHFQDR